MNIKEFIIKHTGLRHSCHCHNGHYCNCGESFNTTYSLSFKKAIKDYFKMIRIK